MHGLNSGMQAWAVRTADRLFDRASGPTADYEQTGLMAMSQSVGRVNLIMRILGCGAVGLSVASQSWMDRSQPGKREHAMRESLATVIGCTWSLTMMRQIRTAEGWHAVRDGHGWFAADLAASTFLALLVGGAPKGSVPANGSGALFHFAVTGGFVWTSLRGVNSGAAAAVAGAGLTGLLARMNRARLDIEAQLNPFWGFLGVAVVASSNSLMLELVRRGGLAETLNTRRTVSDMIHNTALHAIDEVLADPYLDETVRTVLSPATFKLRNFLNATVPGQPDSLSSALAEDLSDLDTDTFKVELVCDLGPLSDHRASAIRVATRAAVSNAARHAGVDRVWVLARRRPDGSVVVAIRDEGRGFDSRSTPGYGLAAAIVRTVTDAGGTVRIRSGDNVTGTLVRLSFDAPVGGGRG